MEQLGIARDGTPGAWPSDRESLMAMSDAAVEVDQWAAAARLGVRAISPDPRDVGPRLEVAWRTWRAGRPADALGLLEALPDEVHPAVALLRAAAVVTRDRRPAAVRAMLTVAAGLPPTGLHLMIVALAAREVGDQALARDAAQRYLATVGADEPTMRGIVAPAQAEQGEMAAAVASTEQACAVSSADREKPIDDVVAELRRGGRDDLAARFLAQGFAQTGRLRYGELLDGLLPTRVRQRLNWVVAPMLVIALVWLGVFALRLQREDLAALGIILVTVGGLGVSLRGVLLRAPGTNLVQTNQVMGAVLRYRKRVGRGGLLLPVLGATVLGFADGALKGATRTTPLLTRIALLPLIVGVVIGALAGVVMLVVGRRRRARIRASLAERVPSERCRCWERDWFTGPTWHDYRDRHLRRVASHRALGATLLACPATAKTWLHLDDADLTVRVALPGPTAPARHSAAYL